jgi:hypothetical protein
VNLFEWSQSHHDPGGKVKLKLPDHVKSDAVFSACGRYRQILTRQWDAELPLIMFVGMNPSQADHTHDDPTVRKECGYAKRWGYGGMIKCNVMDYRCTNPKGLLVAHVTPCSDENLIRVVSQLHLVHEVVAAWGKLPPSLKPHAHAMCQLLKKHDKKISCLGVNLDGSPRHPL